MGRECYGTPILGFVCLTHWPKEMYELAFAVEKGLLGTDLEVSVSISQDSRRRQ